MGKNICLISVAAVDLVEKKIAVFCIMLGRNIKPNNRRFMDGYHVIETKKAETTIIQLHNMLSGAYVFMIWLGRFQRNKILKATDEKNNADIWAALAFIKRDAIVAGMKISDIFVRMRQRKRLSIIRPPLEKEKRDRQTLSRFSCPCFLSSYLTARNFRFFRSLLNGKGFPLFSLPT